MVIQTILESVCGYRQDQALVDHQYADIDVYRFHFVDDDYSYSIC